MRQILHVAQDAIRANTKDGGLRPAIIIRNYRGARRAHEVELVVEGKVVGRFVYSPHQPLSCGARLWLECNSDAVELRPICHTMKEAA